jgi:hypothetical protein
VRDDGGFTTIQYVVATALSLVLFVLVANLLVDLYERGVVRDALDEGVRSAVPLHGSAAACEERVRAVVRAIGGGSALHVDALQCDVHDGVVVATADATMRSWLPGLLPSWHVRLRASVRREA